MSVVAPTTRRLAPGAWARANLFNSILNTVLTIVFGAVIAIVVYRVARFALVTAEWEVVRRNLRIFMVGRFPPGELWRIWAAAVALAAALGTASGAIADVASREASLRDIHAESVWRSAPRRLWPVGLVAAVVLGFADTLLPVLLTTAIVAVAVGCHLAGRHFAHQLARFTWLIFATGLIVALQVLVAGGGVGWNRWGGFLLTLFATVAGIGVAFPVGVLLALGRRSTLPAMRLVSIIYIEFMRGVPLITLLLMGQFMLGFLLPPGASRPSLVTRALIAIILFEAAYVAEVVRGGLQSLSRGQVEAGQALGLSPLKVTRLIVLPQALRAVIPAMVGQFISLYKDTSLLSILGLLELLQVAQNVTKQPDFLGQGLASVTLAFAGFLYWAGSYTMSRESQRLERRLGVGER